MTVDKKSGEVGVHGEVYKGRIVMGQRRKEKGKEKGKEEKGEEKGEEEE